MTVSNVTRSVRASGNGITTAFSFSFPVFASTDIKVYKIDTSVSPESQGSALVENTDYTVSLNATSEGGTVTYTVAPTSDEDSFIIRDISYTQATDIETNEGFDEEAIEDALDKITMLTIQNNEELSRSIKVNEYYDGSADFTLPNPEASKVIGWASDGLTMENYSGSDIDQALVTDFGESLVTSADAEAARTVLDFPDASTTVKGLIELLTNAELATGTDTTRAATAAAILSLFNTSSIASPGYSRVPVNEGGTFTEKIEQWGVENLIPADTTNTINLPITFPTAILNGVLGAQGISTIVADVPNIQLTSTSQIKITNAWSGSLSVYWRVLGN